MTGLAVVLRRQTNEYLASGCCHIRINTPRWTSHLGKKHAGTPGFGWAEYFMWSGIHHQTERPLTQLTHGPRVLPLNLIATPPGPSQFKWSFSVPLTPYPACMF
jgi:hypothetical protein